MAADATSPCSSATGRDDTFGFGVVFSDQTLDTFESYDRESYRAIIGHFAYWDDIEIHFHGTTHRIGGNGFCGCAAPTLLKFCAGRARSLGVEINRHQVGHLAARPGHSAMPISSSPPTASIRASARRFADRRSSPASTLRPNYFSWMGSTRPFDAFTFFFRETEHGIFIAHCYQYEPQRSTWVLETDPRTFARAGLDQLDEEASARFLETLFAEELAGPPAHHQPLALAQLPDHPLRALGRRTTSC